MTVTRWKQYVDRSHIVFRIALFFFSEIVAFTSFDLFRRYWLFGEKDQKGNAQSKRVRGWFPRPCAIEVIEGDLKYSRLLPDNLYSI